MTKYKSNISKYTKYLFIFIITVILVATVPALFSDDRTGLTIVLAINGITLLFLFWLYFTTAYYLTNETLICKSGPFKQAIELKTIKKIEHHNGIVVPVTWKMSWDKKGIIITYNSYDDIYISPKKQEEFINKLIEINPNIKIIGNA